MPRTPSHPPVPRINPTVVNEAFRKPATSEAGYYILEKGKTLVCLRVRKTNVQIGVRHQSRWYSVATLRAGMSIQEVEDVRMGALHLARQLQDGEGIPALSRGRSMTLAQLHQEYMADLRETRGEVLSESTLKNYNDVWRLYLLPAAGHLTLPRLTVEVARQIKRDIPALVLKSRPEASSGGRYMANAALQQLYAALDFAYRMEWVTRNVASARLGPRYVKRRSEEFLDAEGYTAVGQVLRDLEHRLSEGQESPLSVRTLLALRVAIYTGVRHRSELLWTRLEWCRLEDNVPRIGIPRAKGDRGSGGGGRWIFLGPDAVRCLNAIPRPLGSEHLTVPGDKTRPATLPPQRGLAGCPPTRLSAGDPRQSAQTLLLYPLSRHHRFRTPRPAHGASRAADDRHRLPSSSWARPRPLRVLGRGSPPPPSWRSP